MKPTIRPGFKMNDKSVHKKAALAIVILLSLSSCWYNNKWEKLHPYGQNSGPPACGDTTAVVSYSLSIKPIIEQNCAISTCHDGSLLSNYNISANVVSDAQGAAPNDIMSRISLSSGATGFMPSGGSQLPVCDIQKIRLWIKGGCQP